MKTAPARLTRRDFIGRVARFGGAAALGAMFALDLMAREDGGRPKLEGRAPAKKRRVIVLGAGQAGLATAYELGLLGYECTVLEARLRPGGRCWTVRRGTAETELGGEKQVCAFDDGLFLNAGPMRIPHHHESTLAYCREFAIPLVVFPNVNEAAYVHRTGQPKLRFREVRSDWRGYAAELLAKTIQQAKLDAPLTRDDRERIVEYLREEGRLNADLAYRGGIGTVSRLTADPDDPRGYTVKPGAGDAEPVVTQPLDLEALIKAGYPSALEHGRAYNFQSTMLTPAGGMDRIAYGFAERLGNAIKFGAQVREVRRTTDGGVNVRYAAGGEVREIAGDFCVCALPPALAGRLATDFSKPALAALALATPGASGKIGLQFKRRFWEQDDDIYGGLSLTDQPITQIGYPFDGYATKGKGVLLGYYHFGNSAHELDDQPLRERERRALEQGARIHPQYPAEFENSFSVAWQKIPHNEMPWTDWTGGEESWALAQRVLGEGEGPFFFAGDWLSHYNGWQNGAFASAHRACRALHARALKA